MIEGHLTETDLVAAQAALDAGDRGLDRSILTSLRQTERPDTQPLIPDLDDLYSLLDSSEGDSA
jgi:type I restriction enzyme S subunit